jgi:hypothetical protein
LWSDLRRGHTGLCGLPAHSGPPVPMEDARLRRRLPRAVPRGILIRPGSDGGSGQVARQPGSSLQAL